MNTKFFDPYFHRLLREHIAYICAFILFVALDASVIVKQITHAMELKTEIDTTQEQLSVRLKEKDTTDIILSGYDASSVTQALDRFFPRTEDFYSIFSALETLSARTGLYIEAFSPVPFTPSEKDFVTVKVDATGTKQALLALLENPFYISGRLATLHDVTYTPTSSRITFTMKFYTNPSVSRAIPVRNPKNLSSVLAAIVRYKPETVDQPDSESVEYEGKGNPFSPL